MEVLGRFVERVADDRHGDERRAAPRREADDARLGKIVTTGVGRVIVGGPSHRDAVGDDARGRDREYGVGGAGVAFVTVTSPTETSTSSLMIVPIATAT